MILVTKIILKKTLDYVIKSNEYKFLFDIILLKDLSDYQGKNSTIFFSNANGSLFGSEKYDLDI
jgi:hypothetical protein